MKNVRGDERAGGGADLLLLSPRNAQGMTTSFSSAARSPEGWHALQDELHDDIGLEVLPDIERRMAETG